MAVQGDFSLIRLEDGVLNVTLAPPTSIQGWSIVWTLQKRFGYTDAPIAVRSCASGFYGTSGISLVDAGQGRFAVTIRGSDTSGLNFGNYAQSAVRTDSGYRTVLTDGYLELGAGIG